MTENKGLCFSDLPTRIETRPGSRHPILRHISGGSPPYRFELRDCPQGVAIDEASGELVVSEQASARRVQAQLVVHDSEPVAVAPAPPEPPVAPPPARPGLDLPVFAMTPDCAGELPWAWGHAFAPGQVPHGTLPRAPAAAALDVHPRNRWGDGSLKFALMTGITGFDAGVRRALQLEVGAAPPARIALPVVSAGQIEGTDIAHDVAGTVRLVDAIDGADLRGYRGATGVRPAQAGLVRVLFGELMTESHYYAPFPGAPQLSAFWHVRCFADGRIWVETIVENGFARIGRVAQVDGAVTVRVGGQTIYEGTVRQRHRNRWSRQAWIGGDPGIVPHHDGAHLCATGLVPNYLMLAPPGSALAGLPQAIDPCRRGPLKVGSAGPGVAVHIGLLSRYDALYVTSNGDARAYRAMLAIEQACNALTMQPADAGFAWRDERTLEPIDLWEYRHHSLSNQANPKNGGGAVYGGIDTGPADGWDTDTAHGISAGYLAYLVTGRWFSLDTCRMLACAEHLAWGVNGSLAKGYQRWPRIEDRGKGWGLRSIACALAVTPDEGAQGWREGCKRFLEDGLTWYHELAKPGNNALGVAANLANQYPSYTLDAAGKKVVLYQGTAPFQCAYLLQSLGQHYNVAAHLVSEEVRDKWRELVSFHGLIQAGLAGQHPGGWCYRNFSHYEFPMRYAEGGQWKFFASWADAYEAARAVPPLDPVSKAREDQHVPEVGSCVEGLSLLSSPEPDLRAGQQYAALSYAVDFGTPGAADGYRRITTASNWAKIRAGFAAKPEFGIAPRSL